MTAPIAPAAITAAGATGPMEILWTPEANRQAVCPARDGGHGWQLVIAYGAASITCSDCGEGPFPDHEDMIVMAPVPVQIEEVHHHRDGRCPLPPDIGCDCGSDLKVTVAR